MGRVVYCTNVSPIPSLTPTPPFSTASESATVSSPSHCNNVWTLGSLQLHAGRPAPLDQGLDVHDRLLARGHSRPVLY
jgi:hypothetical protein